MTEQDNSVERSIPGTERYVGSVSTKQKLRILLLNPVCPPEENEGPFPLAKKEHLSCTTTVDEIYCLGAPSSLEDTGQSDMSVPFVLEKTRWAESQGYDLVIINCMLDPGLKQAKAAVSIPVIGMKEATTAVALMVGKNPAYIYPGNIAVLNLNDNAEQTYQELLEVGRKKIVNQGADVLIPNCAYLGGLADRLQTALGVPVLANLDIALRIGELVGSFDLKREQDWVTDTRSSWKILLTKLYELPVIGNAFYNLARLLKNFVRP